MIDDSPTLNFQFVEYSSAVLLSAENGGNVMCFCVSTRNTDIFLKVKFEAHVRLKGLTGDGENNLNLGRIWIG